MISYFKRWHAERPLFFKRGQGRLWFCHCERSNLRSSGYFVRLLRRVNAPRNDIHNPPQSPFRKGGCRFSGAFYPGDYKPGGVDFTNGLGGRKIVGLRCANPTYRLKLKKAPNGVFLILMSPRGFEGYLSMMEMPISIRFGGRCPPYLTYYEPATVSIRL